MSICSVRLLELEEGKAVLDAPCGWVQGNRTQLRGFARVLRRGGRLAMDLHNRDDVLRRMPPSGALVSVR